MSATRCEICKRYPCGFGREACDCNKPNPKLENGPRPSPTIEKSPDLTDES